MKIQQLSIFLQNRVGNLSKPLELLSQNNVNIRALCMADTSEFGILRLVVDNPQKGKEILDNFSEYLPKFKKVIPYDYNRMQMAIVQMQEKGLNAEQAQIEVFYASTRG